MTPKEIMDNDELDSYIKSNSKHVNKIVGNNHLFMETLWAICEDYYKLRTKINKDYEEKND